MTITANLICNVIVCCRPLSTVTALPGSSPLTQAAKRRAEAAQKHKHTDVPARRNMVKKEEAVDETTVKRRRRSAKGGDQNGDDVSAEHDQKQVLLPQKKRAFLSSSSPGQSPAKKSSKSNGGPEGNVDNETLIRETEADLKSLSGSWPGPRHAFYRDTEDRFEPGFENLFDEKKSIAAKCSVSSVSSVNSENSSCSLKDVITLRDQQDAKETKSGSRTVNGNQGKQESTKSAANTKTIPKPPKEDKEEQQKRIQERNYLENLMKIEKECASIQSQVKSKSKIEQSDSSKAGQRYEPDFNELVDDSSNELQIDMSESDDKNGKSDKKKKDNDDKRDGKGNKSTASSYVAQQKNEKTKDSQTAFATPAPFRDSNEQSKLPSNNIDLQTPIGPFPAGATFVGYPQANVAPSSRIPPEEKPPVVCLLPLKPATTKVEPADEPAVVTSTKVSVSSPENPASKQYTILQPAGAGSRAASAIKDVAQKGVPGVPAVSSSTSANADSSSNPKTQSLSPSAIGKGNCSIFYFKLHLKYEKYVPLS